MNFKELIDYVRPTSLNDILNVHGLSGIREGNSVRYKDETTNIIVTGDKWYNNKAGQGGVGPIDLVSHLRNCSFRDSVLWLANKEHFVHSPTRSIREKEPIEALPYDKSKQEYALRDDSRWNEARSYLVDKRCLNPELVDEFFKKGDIYATERGGVAFIHRNVDGEDVGLTIRSIKHQSGFRQSLGRKTTGWFTVGDLKMAREIVVVESAIDALSFFSLFKPEPETAIVAVSGAYSPLPLLEHAKKNDAAIISAYDNDQAGLNARENLNTAWMQLTHGEGDFFEKVPTKKDWNEDLCQKISVRQSQRIKI
jgi:hypothetical protein